MVQQADWGRAKLRTTEYEKVCFDLNERHVLNLAIKYDEDDYCYAYNSDNSQHADLRLQKHLIRSHVFYAEVTIGAVGVNVVECFELSCKGPNSTIDIRRAKRSEPIDLGIHAS